MRRDLVKTSCLLLILAALGGVGSGCTKNNPNPNPDLGPIDALGLTRLDHSPFGSLIQRFAQTRNGNVLFDYRGFAANAQARAEFDQYLGLLAVVNPSTLESAAERQAYWINAYNAYVILAVITRFNNDPNYRPLLDGPFFTTRSYVVAGEQVSLDFIEHGVLRGRPNHASVVNAPAGLAQKAATWYAETWPSGQRDLRLHAALNCASLGCPNLPNTAPYVYQGATMDTQLTQQTAQWLASTVKGAGPNGISLIFGYYPEDFSEGGGVMPFITTYRPGGASDVRFDLQLDYDVSLNDVSKG